MSRRVFLVLVLLSVALLPACSQIIVPVDPVLAGTGDKVPVVLVPGVTGTGLLDPATGRLVWGDGMAVIRPHDGGYALVKPLPPGVGRPGGALEPTKVLDAVRLGPITKEVYGPIVRLLERHGYSAGELASPRPGNDLFLFAYDWRDENAVSAARLAEALERLRRARGEERLTVNLVCQSNGAHVCRWLAKFGGATLEEAESGAAAPPAWLGVRKLVLISSSNGGSLENLAWLTRGRRYVAVIGRRWTPEAIASIRAVFEDLPVYTRELFVDGSGEPLAVDLFDLDSWRRYGWSLLSPAVVRRIERRGRRDLFGDAAERAAYLGRMLDRAQRFHRQLRRDVAGFDGVRYYMIQNVDADTPARAVLARRGDGWRLRFAEDRWVRRRPLWRRRLVESGDGHATVDSQLWLAPQERAAMAAEPARVSGDHFELILAPAAQRRLLASRAEAPRAEASTVGSR
ncbi:MAG: esterase/lipase family protein [Thermoanaerobaculia bacterium]